MPIQNDSLNKSLYGLLKTRGYEPVAMDSTGKTTPVPDEADVFKFTYKDNNGNPVDKAWITIENGNTIKVYYDDDIMESDEETGGFTNFLKQLKKWGQSRQLSFELENQNHLASDMAQREHMKKKENIKEGYYPMGKTASYNDNIPTIKIVLQHTRQIQEGEQRYRNIARIFLENQHGERILAPTIRPGIAQVYARHLAEGGVPNDERWNHIKGLCEEYTKMAGFVRAVRSNQFNESAQRLVEAGLNHYTGLRETLSKMRGSRGYNTYFESWTPTLMENEGEETNLNELFVQETLDPRIESVMPILSRLKINLGEMKEVDELAEWAESITEVEELNEAPGAMTLKHNQDTEEKNIKALGMEESEDAEDAHKKTQIPAFMRKGTGDPDWKTSVKDLEKAKERHISGAEGLSALTKRLEKIGAMEEGHDNLSEKNEEEIEESGLQAYLGNKKYGKEGMDALRKAGREHASKEKMAQIRAKYDKLDEEGVAEGQELYGLRTGDTVRAEVNGQTVQGDVIDIFPDTMEVELLLRGPNSGQTVTVDVRDTEALNEQGVAEGSLKEVSLDLAKKARDKAEYYVDMDYDDMRDRPEGYSEKQRSKFQRYIDRKEPRAKGDRDWDPSNKGVAEDLDANQKRVGQLGPTEKVKNNNIGKLVGANESVELSEMDKSQPSSDRGGESSGNPYAKGGKATPVKAKDAERDAEKVLNKSMDKAHNKAIKEEKIMQEGQEDLDFIKNLVKPQLKEDSDKVKFLGFTGSQYPLEKALAEKNFRMGTLRSMKMDARGRPYAIIYDPASYGDFVAYWNDSVGAWTIDFD